MNSVSGINFKSNPKEVEQLQKTCKKLANKIGQKNVSRVPVDMVEINDKVYLAAVNKKNESKIMLEVKDKSGMTAYTCIKKGSSDENKNFLNSMGAVKSVSSAIKQLLEFLAEKKTEL